MSYEFADLTVILSLQEDVKRYIEDPNLLEGDDLEVVESALVLLRYYMKSNQYQQWYADIEKDIEKLFAVAGGKKYAEGMPCATDRPGDEHPTLAALTPQQIKNVKWMMICGRL